MKSGIYKITNIITNKIYIGSAINLKTRGYNHFYALKHKKHANLHLQSSYNKYGKNAFKFKPICYCDEKDLIEFEQKALDSYKKSFSVYNLRDKVDSNRGLKRSEECKEKMSNARMGKKLPPRSLEWSDRISKSLKGRKHSQETIDKMKKRVVSEETRELISKKQTGRKLSPESILKRTISRRLNKSLLY